MNKIEKIKKFNEIKNDELNNPKEGEKVAYIKSTAILKEKKTTTTYEVRDGDIDLEVAIDSDYNMQGTFNKVTKDENDKDMLTYIGVINIAPNVKNVSLHNPDIKMEDFTACLRLAVSVIEQRATKTK